MNFNSDKELVPILIDNLAKQISKHTIIISQLDDNGVLKSKGSGLLFEYKFSYFLISASHVLELIHSDDLFLSCPSSSWKLSGDIYRTNIPEFTLFKKKYSIDIGAIKLDEEMVFSFSNEVEFLQLENLGINQKNKNKEHYFVLGYPETKVKKDRKGKYNWIVEPLYFTTRESSNQIYQKKKIDSKLHVIVDFNRKVNRIDTGQRVIMPQLEGISGCGLWNIRGVEGGQLYYKLTGILTDYSIGAKSILIASRIEMLSDLLRECFGLTTLPRYYLP